jgi:predicted hotdog family 3-hydroxylacyl-ACP dehydratase
MPVSAVSYPAIEELLPHRGAMLLIERVIFADAERLSAQTRVNSGAWYADADGNMPVWIGIELMAQAIAAFVGLEHRRRGDPIKVGFLLGTRKFSAETAAYPPDAVLGITACLAYRDPNGLGAFDCYITVDGRRVAEATIKVYEPDDAERFVRENP